MSTVVVEQRLPVYVQFLSRVPAYAHFIQSVLSILVLWVYPSLAPKMPARQITYKPGVLSIYSFKSTTSTLVEFSLDKADGSMSRSEDACNGFDAPIKSYDFSKPKYPRKTSPSLTLVPFVRRMSISTRRLTKRITTVFSSSFQTPLRNPSLGIESNSNFTSHNLSNFEVDIKVETVEKEIDKCCVVEVADENIKLRILETLSPTCLKKSTKFKRAVKKARAFLHIRRRV
ncbi:hypothetical protein FPV67DRAFT_1663656 [Lyophyllum atratum]|nr:hypothetical protein FPV67DRAFT_1663656 [Lyophyllum atratum]